MQNPFFEAGQEYIKPFEKITQLQMEAGERLMKSHSNLVSDLFNKGMTYTETVLGKSTIDEVWKAQQTFFSDCGESMRHATEDNMGVITDVNEKIAEIIQGSMPDMPTLVDVKNATIKNASAAKKPVTKAAKQTTKKTSANTKTATKKATASAKKATDKAAEDMADTAEAIAAKADA